MLQYCDIVLRMTFKRYVMEWLSRIINSTGADWQFLEIECKFGALLEKQSGNRFSLPVMTETVLHDSTTVHFRFQSDMTMDQHAGINRLLNKQVSEQRGNISYMHLYELDSYYQLGLRRCG
ncbi:CYTH-like domain-containing protein [Chytridium lagenaria]|nr:CYTH-like domain-containing protein [Chytridium lagenaria]